MENKQSNQSRFLIAAVLSMAVLFGWSYFFVPKKTTGDNTNTAQTAANTAATPAATPQNAPPPTVAATTDNTPNRQITIKSPLYEVKLDSKGALATSWILLKDKSTQNERPVYADGSTETDKKPLQLISPEAANRNPRELPFRLSTDDQNLNAVLNDRNYQISSGEDTITLGEGQEKQIDFTLNDNGVQVTKSFVFRADSYVSDLGIKLTNNGQVVPNTKLLIGSSIGDQGIVHHSYYHIEPEAVSIVGGKTQRYTGTAFTYANDQATHSLDGAVDWAGIADAYFAMAAIPAQPTQGLEYRATKYEFPVEPYYDGIIAWVTRSQKATETRHLITAYVPINADGSVTKIYTGTKDYFALSDYNDTLTASVGRPIDIEETINYGWFGFLTKPLSKPILVSLNWLNHITHNYGISIILFTILFYSLLFPLRWSQSRSFKKASANAPKMKDIQDRLKDLQKQGVPADDPRMREVQMEQLKMTKDALPIGGCLPMLLQFPLLFAFYTAVTVSLAIRQATFLWLPDLSASDPYHILNFIFVGSMVLSMKLTPTTPTVTPEQQMQQKMMTYFMPLMLLWVMWSSPAGLLLYWCVGNFVSFGQQMIINKMNKNGAPPSTQVVDSVPDNAKKVKPKFSTT